jgi:hypothetical protein
LIFLNAKRCAEAARAGCRAFTAAHRSILARSIWLYVYIGSQARIGEQCALRRKRCWARLKELHHERALLTDTDPAKLWEFYLQLSEFESAFKDLKGDLAIRPIHHQNEERIKAHIFVAFMAYCLHVTPKQLLRQCAPGLTPRVVLDSPPCSSSTCISSPSTGASWSSLATPSPSPINNSYLPNSVGPARAGPAPDQRRIRARGVGQTLDIRPL